MVYNVSTMIIAEQIRNHLDVLMGSEFWGVSRVHNLLMLEFGEKREVPASIGTRTIGQYSLHIECPWRLIGSAGIIAGSEDCNVPNESFNGTKREWDGEETESLADSKLRRFLAMPHREVESIETDMAGGFKLIFRNSHAFEVFPCSANSSASPWRLVRR